MPFTPLDLTNRAVLRPGRVREQPDVPFDDLVYLLAEGVAEAQTKLDLSTAQTLQTLAETRVDVVPSVTRTVADDGTVTSETAPGVSRSLLELGFTPTRYQFAEATVDVSFDITIAEHEETEREEEGRLFGLRAGTYELNEQRTYDREVTANASLSARLVPTPLPVDLQPDTETDTE